MDYSEVLLGLRQAIACGKISQQDLNLIIQYPQARETLREAFGSLNAEHINRMLNEADISITENDAGQPQLEISVHLCGGFPYTLKMTLPSAQPAHLQSSPEPEITCACCGLNVCEITETEVHLGERPLPPFDPTIERVAPARYPEVPSGAMASGDFSKVVVTRESVSVEEVIAKIEALERENETPDTDN